MLNRAAHLAMLAWATTTLAQTPSALPVEISIAKSPAGFVNGGSIHYVYEIVLTNLDKRGRTMTLDQVEVRDQGQGVVSSPAKSNLLGMFAPAGSASKAAGELGIAAGARATLFMWASVPSGSPQPTMLRHRFRLKLAGLDAVQTVECCEARISAAAPLVLEAPLRGEGWLAANGPSNLAAQGEHRRTSQVLDGRLYNPQRLAIDWIAFGSNGRLGQGNGKKNTDYFAFGKEVLAAADGVVCAAQDGATDNSPGSIDGPLTVETLAGNAVCLDVGDGRYAWYAHLENGSLRVKKGDRVRVGQVLGLVGNSGNSDAPHLHFQVTDSPSVIASEGIPFVFRSYALQGQATETGDDFRFQASGPEQPRAGELPLYGEVVKFP